MNFLHTRARLLVKILYSVTVYLHAICLQVGRPRNRAWGQIPNKDGQRDPPPLPFFFFFLNIVISATRYKRPPGWGNKRHHGLNPSRKRRLFELVVIFKYFYLPVINTITILSLANTRTHVREEAQSCRVVCWDFSPQVELLLESRAVSLSHQTERFVRTSGTQTKRFSIFFFLHILY